VAAQASILAVRGLSAIRARRVVLEDVALELPAGTVTALIGPSGAGKTSLLRCLVRLDEAAEGSVRLDGADVRGLDAGLLRRRVGLVAQSPVMLPGDVRANVAYGLEDAPEAELVAALEAADLHADYLHRPADRLSGGERARVAIARALTRSPEALLLDEPTASLDTRSAAVIEVLMLRLAARGLAVLVVTHDLAQARRVATRAVRLENGRVRAQGPVAAVAGDRQ
jgi:ABC-type multidrug transport system fused ATPase/permease subunit